MIETLIVIAALVVLMRVCCTAAKLSPGRWSGPRWKLGGMALGLGLELASTCALLLGMAIAGYGLLLGYALLIICDRRRLPWEASRS